MHIYIKSYYQLIQLEQLERAKARKIRKDQMTINNRPGVSSEGLGLIKLLQ